MRLQESIAKHVAILNEEVGMIKNDLGRLKNDISWLKRIIGYMAAIITGSFITIISISLKYLFK